MIADLQSRPAAPYLQLLGTLHLLLTTIRKEGLFAIEDDIANPRESVRFNAIAPFDTTNALIYALICDVLDLMNSGVTNRQVMADYLAAYRQSSALTAEQISLFDCVRLAILVTLDGEHPRTAIEFGRQGIPAEIKPSASELADFIREISRGPEPTLAATEARLDAFFDSIGAAPAAGITRH